MAKVIVQAGLDGSGFSAGLRKLSAEGERFSADLNRKFSPSRTLGKVLEGIGIGSGLAIAQKISDAIADSWKRAADEAERMERSSEAALDTQKQIIALRQTPRQQLSVARKDLRDAQQVVEGAREKKSGWSDDGFWGKLKIGRPEQVRTELDSAELEKAEAKYNAAQLKVAQLQKQVDGLNEKDQEAFTERLNKQGREDAEAKGMDYDEFNHYAIPKKKPAADPIIDKTSDDRRENISASSLAMIGGGGNVNAIGPVSPVVAELKTQTGVLQGILKAVTAQGGPGKFDIHR